MTSSSATRWRGSRIGLRHIVFAALLPLFLFVLWHDERFIFIHSDQKWAYYFPVRWLVLLHVLGGLTALLIGPFQFSSRFRQRHLRVHRIMGRIYLASVAAAATVAFYVSVIHQKEMQDRQWVFALDIAWLITGVMAFAAVRNGNIEMHRQWIARNYAFTTVFVTVRVLGALPIPDAYGSQSGWMLLLATLLLTEIGLSWRSVFTNRRLQPPAMAPSPTPELALAEADS
jgi:uncharacterized membrane protein